MKLALSLLTCDRLELVEQSIKPLLAAAIDNRFHLFVIDGSTSEANEKAIWDLSWPTATMHANIRGGAGAAIVYALTMMLNHKENYDYVGLTESDVLLHGDWFSPMFDLFRRGSADGLEVGAVSARCYVDRVLIQRDGYAVLHNAGAGQILFSRRAAQVVLDTFRTPWTSDNRRIFSQLCGIDIAAFWAFRANEHYLTADFHWEPALASAGLATLALTPSPVEMIGQNPPLAEQGLEIATGPVEERRNDKAFEEYRDHLQFIQIGMLQLGVETKFQFDSNTGTWTYFPHQMAMLGGTYVGDWRLVERRGWGTFGWMSGDSEILEESALTVPAFGPISVLVSGGKTGGKVEVCDEQSGFRCSPDLPPEGDNGQVLSLAIPGGVNYRNIRITALTPGCVFYGIQSREKQPFLPNVSFDYNTLPKP